MTYENLLADLEVALPDIRGLIDTYGLSIFVETDLIAQIELVDNDKVALITFTNFALAYEAAQLALAVRDLMPVLIDNEIEFDVQVVKTGDIH